jgi:hypothetical protein
MMWLMLALAFAAIAVLGYVRTANRVAHQLYAPAAFEQPDLNGVPARVLSIVWLAFAVRLILGTLLSYYGWDRLLAPDTEYYTEFGMGVARVWTATGGVNNMDSLWGSDQLRFVLLNSIVHYIFGHGRLIMLVLSSAAGAWTVLLSWRIANHFCDAAAAYRVVLLTAFFPSLVVWSALTLRDPYMVLAVTGAIWATIQLKEEINSAAVMRLIMWSVVIGIFRDYMLLLVGCAAAVAFVGGARIHLGRDMVVGGIAFTAIAAIIIKLGLGDDYLLELNFESVKGMRSALLWQANSAYMVEANPGSLTGALKVLPVGVFYFLYGPLPWRAVGLLQTLTVPEMLFWYWLTPKIVRGVRHGWRTNLPATWAMVVFALVLILAYGLVSGNVGTAYRHRAQVLPILLVFAGTGWSLVERARTETEQQRVAAA